MPSPRSCLLPAALLLGLGAASVHAQDINIKLNTDTVVCLGDNTCFLCPEANLVTNIGSSGVSYDCSGTPAKAGVYDGNCACPCLLACDPSGDFAACEAKCLKGASSSTPNKPSSTPPKPAPKPAPKPTSPKPKPTPPSKPASPSPSNGAGSDTEAETKPFVSAPSAKSPTASGCKSTLSVNKPSELAMAKSCVNAGKTTTIEITKDLKLKKPLAYKFTKSVEVYGKGPNPFQSNSFNSPNVFFSVSLTNIAFVFDGTSAKDKFSLATLAFQPTTSTPVAVIGAGGSLKMSTSSFEGIKNNAVVVLGSASLDMSTSSFDNGFSQIAGAALRFKSSGKLSVSTSSFTGNEANCSGGAVYLGGGGTAKFSTTSFDSNTADNNGGGMAVDEGSKVSFSTTSFDSNSATNGGGLATAGDVTLSLTVSFDGNTASGKGSQIAASDRGTVKFTSGFNCPDICGDSPSDCEGVTCPPTSG